VQVLTESRRNRNSYSKAVRQNTRIYYVLCVGGISQVGCGPLEPVLQRTFQQFC